MKGHEFTSEQSREQAAINGRKGGIASGQKRREIKSFRELLEVNLDMESANSVTGEKKTAKDIGMMQLAKKVKDGDLKAIKLAAQLLGELKQDVNINGSLGVVQMTKEEAEAEYENWRKKIGTNG